jgi:hypothetical protein
MEGFHRLALAVLQQTVNDLTSGTAPHKNHAAECVLAGGLDRWAAQITSEHHAYEAIRSKLRELAEAATARQETTTPASRKSMTPALSETQAGR